MISPEEARRQLYIRQKELLDTFRVRNAISQEEYNKSLNYLTTKMDMGDLLQQLSEDKRK